MQERLEEQTYDWRVRGLDEEYQMRIVNETLCFSSQAVNPKVLKQKTVKQGMK